MFNALLVPLDGTPDAAVALPPARALASATHASIALLRVVQDAADLAEARLYLSRVSYELQGAGLAVETAARVGDAAEAIAVEARERRTDLLVIAPRGVPSRTVPVSVTQRVLEIVPVPVLLVRPGGRRVTHFKRLLVPVDGTPGGALALAAASSLAHHTGAEITLLQVVAPLPAYVYESLPGATVGGFVDPGWDDVVRLGAQRYVDALAKTLAPAGIRGEGHVAIGLFGNVAETIARTADDVDADLIVMSTHGLTAPMRSALGSVAQAVVGLAERPVLLVRRETMADRAGARTEVPSAVAS